MSLDVSIDDRLGARIRAFRVDRSMTLEDLAQAAEVSRAMLSRIERGESSPTAQFLNKICGGLSITLSMLFTETEAPGNPLSRRNDQSTWRDPASNYLRRNISPSGTGSPVDIVEVEFPAHASVAFDSQRLAGTDQHVWVLDGMLDLQLGEDVFRLETGDCLMMRFDRPILFRNPLDQSIRYAVIVSHGSRRP